MNVSLAITGFYAALLAIFLVGLSFNVIRMRFKHKVGIGDGGIQEVGQAVRVHANFTEYMPMGLILLACYELNSGDSMWLHVFGATLVVGRVFHVIGLSKTIGTSMQRVIGTLSMFIVLVALAVLNIVNFIH